jgi:hypothetical protein
MSERTPHAIRDRWINYLAPHIRKDPWTPEEDQMLIAKREELGPRWAKIAQFLPGRTSLHVKNRWQVVSKQSVRKNNELSAEETPIPAPAAEPMRFPPIDPDFMLDRERFRIFQTIF